MMGVAELMMGVAELTIVIIVGLVELMTVVVELLTDVIGGGDKHFASLGRSDSNLVTDNTDCRHGSKFC